MFKELAGMASIMKQASQIQGKMSEAQKQLANVRVEGTAGAGMVTVEANGHQKVLSCRIEDAALTGDRELLEDMIAAATNLALEKAKEAAAEAMGKVTEDMNIPGIGDALAKFGIGTPPGTPPETSPDTDDKPESL